MVLLSIVTTLVWGMVIWFFLVTGSITSIANNHSEAQPSTLHYPKTQSYNEIVQHIQELRFQQKKEQYQPSAESNALTRDFSRAMAPDGSLSIDTLLSVLDIEVQN